ncbi:MAG: YraN family protein [Gammaproteobacteria bacterium]|nr:YraN family protein [Gammaproteobacteria bacterium]
MSRSTGEKFERMAETYLQNQGLDVITRNYFCKMGEIDLVCRHQETLVFVEVKYRSTPSHGESVAQVSYSKQRKLIRTAVNYAQVHGLYDKIPMRFDVVAIQPNEEQFEIQWLKNAITADGF